MDPLKLIITVGKGIYKKGKEIVEDVAGLVEEVLHKIEGLIFGCTEHYQEMQKKTTIALTRLKIARGNTADLQQRIRDASRSSNIGAPECVDALDDVLHELDRAIARLENRL